MVLSLANMLTLASGVGSDPPQTTLPQGVGSDPLQTTLPQGHGISRPRRNERRLAKQQMCDTSFHESQLL